MPLSAEYPDYGMPHAHPHVPSETLPTSGAKLASAHGSASSKTFDEFCQEWSVTPQERAELNTYLAVIRLRKVLSL